MNIVIVFVDNGDNVFVFFGCEVFGNVYNVVVGSESFYFSLLIKVSFEFVDG